mmetsp:Transcript_20505/g.43423  ORF Transcript_20505/g.43423 Transcript_20505/m.43423 type:complete len:475 (-) Transcript_20505:217-1641(-)
MNVFIEGGEIVVLRIDELGVNVVNDSRTKNCNQVSREHNLVGTESGDSDGSSLDFGSDEPADEGENESGPGGDDGSGTGGFGPGHHVPEGDDGGSDDDSHEEVDPAEIQSHGVQCDREKSHENTEQDDHNPRNPKNLRPSCLWVNVLPVDIICHQRTDRNTLRTTRGHNGHEQHDQNQGATRLSQQMIRHGRRDQSISSLTGADGQHERRGRETERGGEREGNGKPADSSQQVSLGGRFGAGGDSGLPVTLVDEDGSEVSNDVDDSEHESVGGEHCEVRSGVVVGDGSAGVLLLVVVVVVEGGFDGSIGGEEDLTFFGGVGDGLIEEVIDLVRGVDLDVDNGDHGDEDSEDDHGVKVGCHEGGLETSGGSVKDNSPRNQKTGQFVIHTGESLDGCGSSKQKHGRDDDVGQEREDQESDVGRLAPASADDLAHSVCRGRDILERDGKDTEEEDLDGGARGVPEGARDAVIPGHVG